MYVCNHEKVQYANAEKYATTAKKALEKERT